MQADELEPARKLGARLAPRLLAERRRDRVAVEDAQDECTESIQLQMSVGAMGAQHALDQFRHHREPERIRLPARSLYGLLKARFAKQHLGIMSGPRAGVRV